MIRTPGTIKNLQVFVNSNARTTNTTMRIRKNGADGNNVITIAPGVTNTLYEDTTHTDTVAVGDLIDFVTVTGTGTENLSMSHFMIDFITTDGSSFTCYSRTGGYAQPEPATNYPYIGGSALIASTGTESLTQVKTRAAFTFSQLAVNITANTVNTTSIVRFRKGGADGNQIVSIGSNATGFLFDNANSDICTDTDLVNLRINTPDVTGSQTITLRHFTTVYAEVPELTEVSQTNIRRYSLRQNVEDDNIRRYSLRQNAERLNIRRYSLLSLLDIPSIRRYNLRQFVNPQSIRRYSLRSFVDALNKRRYNILQYLNAQNIRRYSLRQYVERSNIRRYGLRQLAQAISTRVYDVAAAIGVVATTSIRRYTTFEYVSAPSIRKWNLLHQISTETIRLYNILQPTLLVTSENIRRYDLKQFITGQTIRRYNIVEFGKKFYSMLGAGAKIELDQAAKILQDFIRGGYPQ